MAADRLTIDAATIFDNPHALRVEFAADAGDERHAFAVPYDTLRALSGIDPVTEPVALMRGLEGPLSVAGATALSRAGDEEIVVIGEGDL